MKPLTICVGASAGGHMNELFSLLEHTQDWPNQPSIYITTQKLLAKKLQKKGKTYVVGECNRKHPLSAFSIVLMGFKIMRRENPDVIITTGSLPIAIICLVAKLYGKKVIWIDSIAQTSHFSLSGKLMYKFADLFLTQWPEVADKNKKAEYSGALI